MALPQMHFGLRKVLLLYLAFFVLIFMLFFASIDSHELQQTSRFNGGGRRLLELKEEDEQLLLIKKKSSSTKNQTKLIKSSSSSSSSSNQSTKNQTKLVTKSNLPTNKNQTKLVAKSNLSTTKNQTKISKPTNSTKSISSSPLEQLNSTKPTTKTKPTNSTKSVSSSPLKQLNSTKPTTKTKPTNSTKSNTSLTSKKTAQDLLKLSPPKNKTVTKTTSTKTEEEKPQKSSSKEKTPTTQKPKQQRKQPSWIEDDEDTDLVAEFRDLPTKFPQTFIPDLERISTTSKAYITKYNKQITKQFKPYVGNKHAPTIATIISCAFLLIPLLLVSLIFNRIKTYFSLQKVLIFIQVYLSIYFSILCLTSLVTGLEPLKFFYSTSPTTYVCLQVFQTLGYVLYLLLVLMYLILVFSTESGFGSTMLGLVQTFVGLTIGLHYYVAVFHRVVLHQPPKTNWKVHGVYATCFLVICLCARADWRKKAYLEEGGEEGKKS